MTVAVKNSESGVGVSKAKVPITVAYGDGIGPEIMATALEVLFHAGAELDTETIDIGESSYIGGHSSGISPASWDSIRRTGILLKAPVTTPQGGGYKSLNVTIRKSLGLYANVRPCVAYSPFVHCRHPGMNVVIVRENEEDLYGGIEHRQTGEVYQCLKLISRPGCEKIVRYAFEYARAHGRRKVSCFTKDNIMKMTDGLFHKVFDEVSQDYPELEKEHWIVDIGAAKLADSPEVFDVIVMPNLYGDILSDVAAQIAGSIGLAGSANIGPSCAMFEAIHGSAPLLAGQGLANPSGLLQAAVLMLAHVGQTEVAARIQNAWLRTLEDGVHTEDIRTSDYTKKVVGTRAFGEAVIGRLGFLPSKLEPVSFAIDRPLVIPSPDRPCLDLAALDKTLRGVDVFLHHNDLSPQRLGQHLSELSGPALGIKMITNRGLKVWPDGIPETFCTDHWRCRFVHPLDSEVSHQDIVSLLGKLSQVGFDFIKTENLYCFAGVPGYALGQGE